MRLWYRDHLDDGLNPFMQFVLLWYPVYEPDCAFADYGYGRFYLSETFAPNVNPAMASGTQKHHPAAEDEE